jgi:uncharacterized membrane protein YfcA
VEHFVFVTIANVALGALLGAAGGMMGIGGGLIAIPVLGYLYGMDQHLAQGTALVMIVPNVLIGFLRYRQRNQIDLRSTASLAAVAVLSTYIAARYTSTIDPGRLRVAFALFLFAIGVYFSLQLRARPDTQARAPLSSRFLPVLGVLSGVMSGVFSVGGVLVVVPALVTLFRMAQTQAQGMAMALVIPGGVVALITYALAGNVNWTVGIPLAIGGVLSVSWGVALAHRVAPRSLRIMFCLVLFGTAAASLLKN